jgi:ribosomal protein S6
MTNETDKTDLAAVYEVGFHIVPTVSPENLPKEVDAIKALLGREKATIISEEFPKLRNLSYTMIKAVGPARHRCDTAYFGWIKFEAPKSAIAALDKDLKASEKVLRYLIVKTVRENTIYGPKILAEEKKDARDGAAQAPGAPAEAAKPAKPMTQEELDKSIDKLVV